MNREILFRGKRIDNGKWVYGFYLNRSNDKEDIHCIMEIYPATKSKRVDPATVGQYTGLTDKNGKKIFEGDIVEHHVQGDIIVNRGMVNWDAKNARWAHQLNTMNPCFTFFKADAYEVIGNIHDNPELLEGGEAE